MSIQNRAYRQANVIKQEDLFGVLQLNNCCDAVSLFLFAFNDFTEYSRKHIHLFN